MSGPNQIQYIMTNATETRGRGRPKSFPNQETVTFLASIPIDAKEMVTDLAKRREEPINLTLDRMIRRAFAEATRQRSSK